MCCYSPLFARDGVVDYGAWRRVLQILISASALEDTTQHEIGSLTKRGPGKIYKQDLHTKTGSLGIYRIN